MKQDSGAESHGRWEDLIIEVLDGRADRARRAELERHLAECAACRTIQAEYALIFVRLEDAREREPAAFWDGLAAEIERQIAAEPVQQDRIASAPVPQDRIEADTAAPDRTASEPVPQKAPAPVASGPSQPAPGDGQVVDLGERTRFAGGWNGVRGGLIAAGIAILLLVGLYLELPRQAGTPQAFINAPRRAPLGEPFDTAAGARLAAAASAKSGGGASSTQDAALAALASELDEDYDVGSQTQDPLADLAEADLALQGLTAEEAEELVRSLESRT